MLNSNTHPQLDVYKRQIYNDEARRAMLRDLTAMGASGIFLHPEGTELKLHEASQKSGSAQLYETLLDYCDNAESKALLGNTLTCLLYTSHPWLPAPCG